MSGGEALRALVLIVDDDPEIVGMLTRWLEKTGYRVAQARDGEEAVEVALARQPDLIILDVMMPKMSGWETVKVLRADRRTAGIKIVILTAIGDRINELTSPLYEVDAFVDKPFEFKKFGATIKRLLAPSSP